ncbi:hypothetical protein [Cellulomonas dongxiuzhuiae]|uniref:HEAT repeat domain-containing protein n=1 Tax=Cellulomonas dongxiuzhuiae TaxID=2819979 RepID=A0ABX8GJG9_9CELL|nr:hypothetical protein [Cellulomonas dongxiuzhuiae]MBO3094970.1 hypothetical protein [Cellulomonas dongxiuzhuiae]QWC15988.1 hypothetical protein KKR89_17385 [Cellulomonas dongxiuzhuiae]
MMDVDRLKRAAEERALSRSELASVVIEIDAGARGPYLLSLLGVVARARSPHAEELLLRFLDHPEHPDVASWVLHALGLQWRRFDLVADRVRTALAGPDDLRDVRLTAATVAAAMYRAGGADDLLAHLVREVEVAASSGELRLAVEPLVDALGIERPAGGLTELADEALRVGRQRLAEHGRHALEGRP